MVATMSMSMRAPAMTVSSGSRGGRSAPVAASRAVLRPACQLRAPMGLSHGVQAKASFKAATPFLGSGMPVLPLRPVPKAKAAFKVSATAAAAPASREVPPLVPLKVVPALISVAVGLAVRFLAPVPAGVTVQAWQLLSIFLATITGIVLSPLPTGAWAFFGLTTTVLTKTLTFQQAFAAFTNDVIWLIVIVFFVARGFVKTGLGDRAGYMFAKAFGKTTLGLAYALAATEAIICPGMPSTTARHGGVMLPIIAALSRACGSDPADGTEKKMGAYLIVNALYCGGANPSLAIIFICCSGGYLQSNRHHLGPVHDRRCAEPFVQQARGLHRRAHGHLGLLVQVSLLAMPYIIYKVFPPEIKETPDAPAEAAAKLEEMGPPSAGEKIVMATMMSLVGLWIGGASIGVSAPVAGMMGLCALLGTGVLTWADCLNEKGAWDTLLWFAVLVGLSGQLEKLGLISYIATAVSNALAATALPWYGSMALLHLAYFGVHYLFASQTAQVGALYVAFLAMMVKAGAPMQLAALTLSFSTNLFGAITHYASAQGAIYYGAGFVDLKTWWKLGVQLAVICYGIWLAVGIPWWSFIGLIPK